jgi:hypothetical protein
MQIYMDCIIFTKKKKRKKKKLFTSQMRMQVNQQSDLIYTTLSTYCDVDYSYYIWLNYV